MTYISCSSDLKQHPKLCNGFVLYCLRLMVWADTVSDLTLTVGHCNVYLWSSDLPPISSR